MTIIPRFMPDAGADPQDVVIEGEGPPPVAAAPASAANGGGDT
jgi:hypothetical protein